LGFSYKGSAGGIAEFSRTRQIGSDAMNLYARCYTAGGAISYGHKGARTGRGQQYFKRGSPPGALAIFFGDQFAAVRAGDRESDYSFFYSRVGTNDQPLMTLERVIGIVMEGKGGGKCPDLGRRGDGQWVVAADRRTVMDHYLLQVENVWSLFKIKHWPVAMLDVESNRQACW
jgi:hypothetical protein